MQLPPHQLREINPCLNFSDVNQSEMSMEMKENPNVPGVTNILTPFNAWTTGSEL
jgi:hypothetical protein